MSESFKWEKMRKPGVTKCCKSFAYYVTNEGDYCCRCEKILHDNIRVATAEDMRENGIALSDEEYEKAYQ